MKVFIWKRVESCSDNYHTEGGVVAFADSEDRAREIANAIDGCNIAPTEKPDSVSDVTWREEEVFIFPDAGCC